MGPFMFVLQQLTELIFGAHENTSKCRYSYATNTISAMAVHGVNLKR